MIVNDGEFNNASVRKVLENKYPSVIKKNKSYRRCFKNKSKFETQNSIIGMLLTQIKSGKTKTGKAAENQLKIYKILND